MDTCVERFHTHSKFRFYRAKQLHHKHAACIGHERENETLRVVTANIIPSKRYPQGHTETFPTLIHRHCPGHGG